MEAHSIRQDTVKYQRVQASKLQSPGTWRGRGDVGIGNTVRILVLLGLLHDSSHETKQKKYLEYSGKMDSWLRVIGRFRNLTAGKVSILR